MCRGSCRTVQEVTEGGRGTGGGEVHRRRAGKIKERKDKRVGKKDENNCRRERKTNVMQKGKTAHCIFSEKIS